MKNDSDCKISKNTSCSKKNFVAGKNLPYVLATFVHISNIPAATDPILANFLSTPNSTTAQLNLNLISP